MDIESDEDEQRMLDNAHEDVQEFIQKMSYQYTPMMIAACMMVHTLRMYRRHLNDQEYDMMVRKIFEDRNRIKRNDQNNL
jgi:hypothetical protein